MTSLDGAIKFLYLKIEASSGGGFLPATTDAEISTNWLLHLAGLLSKNHIAWFD